MLGYFGLVETRASAVKAGDVFGKLVVLAVGQIPGSYRYIAICRCGCGSDPKKIRFDSLLKGVTVSCGCVQKERTIKHGLSKSIHYQRWRGMLDRCYNETCSAYKNYGGRGITVCDRWHDINNFVAELPDGYFDGAEIDRIDNDGNYEPGNVRWATGSQNSDNRRSARNIVFNGKMQSLRRWAIELGINEGTLWDRISVLGWDTERAFNTPAVSANERMQIAVKARWAGHVKKKKPEPRILKTVSYLGHDLTIKQLSDQYGIPVALLRKRIFERNWPVEKAITKPA